MAGNIFARGISAIKYGRLTKNDISSALKLDGGKVNVEGQIKLTMRSLDFGDLKGFKNKKKRRAIAEEVVKSGVADDNSLVKDALIELAEKALKQAGEKASLEYIFTKTDIMREKIMEQYNKKMAAKKGFATLPNAILKARFDVTKQAFDGLKAKIDEAKAISGLADYMTSLKAQIGDMPVIPPEGVKVDDLDVKAEGMLSVYNDALDQYYNNENPNEKAKLKGIVESLAHVRNLMKMTYGAAHTSRQATLGTKLPDIFKNPAFETFLDKLKTIKVGENTIDADITALGGIQPNDLKPANTGDIINIKSRYKEKVVKLQEIQDRLNIKLRDESIVATEKEKMLKAFVALHELHTHLFDYAGRAYMTTGELEYRPFAPEGIISRADLFDFNKSFLADDDTKMDLQLPGELAAVNATFVKTLMRTFGLTNEADAKTLIPKIARNFADKGTNLKVDWATANTFKQFLIDMATNIKKFKDPAVIALTNTDVDTIDSDNVSPKIKEITTKLTELEDVKQHIILDANDFGLDIANRTLKLKSDEAIRSLYLKALKLAANTAMGKTALQNLLKEYINSLIDAKLATRTEIRIDLTNSQAQRLKDEIVTQITAEIRAGTLNITGITDQVVRGIVDQSITQHVTQKHEPTDRDIAELKRKVAELERKIPADWAPTITPIVTPIITRLIEESITSKRLITAQQLADALQPINQSIAEINRKIQNPVTETLVKGWIQAAITASYGTVTVDNLTNVKAKFEEQAQKILEQGQKIDQLILDFNGIDAKIGTALTQKLQGVPLAQMTTLVQSLEALKQEVTEFKANLPAEWLTQLKQEITTAIQTLQPGNAQAMQNLQSQVQQLSQALDLLKQATTDAKMKETINRLFPEAIFTFFQIPPNQQNTFAQEIVGLAGRMTVHEQANELKFGVVERQLTTINQEITNIKGEITEEKLRPIVQKLCWGVVDSYFGVDDTTRPGLKNIQQKLLELNQKMQEIDGWKTTTLQKVDKAAQDIQTLGLQFNAIGQKQGELESRLEVITTIQSQIQQIILDLNILKMQVGQKTTLPNQPITITQNKITVDADKYAKWIISKKIGINEDDWSYTDEIDVEINSNIATTHQDITNNMDIVTFENSGNIRQLGSGLIAGAKESKATLEKLVTPNAKNSLKKITKWFYTDENKPVWHMTYLFKAIVAEKTGLTGKISGNIPLDLDDKSWIDGVIIEVANNPPNFSDWKQDEWTTFIQGFKT